MASSRKTRGSFDKPSAAEPLTLYTTGLLSKWGFGDGDDVSDWLWDNGVVTSIHDDIDDHKLLKMLVEKYVLPKLNHKIKITFVDTNHNPVRADFIDGVEYSNWYEDDDWEEKLEPKTVDIPAKEVVALAKQLKKKAEDSQ